MRRKTAFWSHLMAGPIGHVVVNALGRAAHHSSNLGDVLAHRGLQHGLYGLSTNPVAMRSVKSLAGAESVVPYETAYRLGQSIAHLGPAERAARLRAMQVAPDTKAPVLSSLRHAVGHELADTTPQLQASGLGAKMYAHAVDRMTGITNTPFDTGLQRAGKSLLGAAPVAGLVAADPVGTASHVGVNAAREALGRSSMGKKFVEDTFQRGLSGGVIPRPVEVAADYLASPAVLDAYRAGKAVRQEVPEAVRQRLKPDAVSSAMSHLKHLFGGGPPPMAPT